MYNALKGCCQHSTPAWRQPRARHHLQASHRKRSTARSVKSSRANSRRFPVPSLPPQVPARDAIRKKIAEFSAAVAGSGGEAASAALSEAEMADGGALDALLTRWGWVGLQAAAGLSLVQAGLSDALLV